MRKTRILAALLCIMMIVTAIPVLQVSANGSVATYTLEQALEGAEQVYQADFTMEDYVKINDAREPYYHDTGEKYVKWKEANYSNDIIRAADGGRLALLCDNEGGFVYPVGIVKSRHNNTADAKAHCRPEMQDADGSLISSSANPRLLVVDMTTEGLAIRAGNDAIKSSDTTTPAGGSGEGAGWSWDNTNANTNYGFLDGKLDVDTGYAGAMLFKLKLTEAGSVAEVKLTDGANGQVSVGFKLSDKGIQMINASNFAYGDENISADYVAAGDTSAADKYPLAVDSWYEILLKNNYNRYTIYAREAGATNFTKVVTGTPVGAAMPNGDKKLSINAYYNSNGLKATELVTINGVKKEYFADKYDTTDAGVTAITAGNGSIALSEVVVESITTYKDSANSGLSLQDVLGYNMYSSIKMDFDNAETKKQLDEGKPLSYWSASTGGTRNAEGNLVLDSQQMLKMDGLTITKMDSNTAFEISYKLPANHPGKQLSFQGNLSGFSDARRAVLDIGSQDYGYMEIHGGDKYLQFYNSRDLSLERTLLFTVDNGNLKYYMKHPVSGKYLYLGKNLPKTGSSSEGFRFKNNTTEANSGKEDYIITGFAVYQKNGLVDSALLPGDTSGMIQYVNEDFTAIDEANYSTYVKVEDEAKAGSTSCVDDQLVITRPTYDSEADTSAAPCTFFDLQQAGIPKGGYANIRFRSTSGRAFRIINGDGETEYTLTIGCDTQALRVTPDATYDLRIVRSTEGNYTAYLKRAEDVVWTKVVDNDAASANANVKNRLRFGGYQFNSTSTYPYATSNTTAIDYVDFVSIYGPAGDQMLTILDDNDNTQTTLVPAIGTKLNYGVKAIVAPGAKKQLIFAGYDAEMNLIAAEPVIVDASESATVKTSTISDSRIKTIKVFLWDDFEKLTSLTPAVSYGAPE